jgi:hypothetical protein
LDCQGGVGRLLILGKVYVDVGGVSTQPLVGLEAKSRNWQLFRRIATISGSGQNSGKIPAPESLFISAHDLSIFSLANAERKCNLSMQESG